MTLFPTYGPCDSSARSPVFRNNGYKPIEVASFHFFSLINPGRVIKFSSQNWPFRSSSLSSHLHDPADIDWTK